MKKRIEIKKTKEADRDKDDPKDSEAEKTEKQLRRDRRNVGQETLKTAGNTKTGFGSTFVNQSAKIKMKRRAQEMFKMMEVMQKVGASKAEMIKNLAASLGASTAQASIGGGLSQLQGMAKQATDRAIDTRFQLMEAVANRANDISGAMRAAIMSTVSLGVTQAVKQKMKSKKKEKAKDKGNKVSSENVKKSSKKDNKKSKAKEEMLDQMMDGVSDLVAGLVSSLISGIAAAVMKDERKASQKQLAGEAQAIGEEMGEDVDEETKQLSGLEARAMSAQFTSANAKELAGMNDLISQLIQQSAQSIVTAIKKAFNVKKIEKAKKELAKDKAMREEGIAEGGAAVDQLFEAEGESDGDKEGDFEGRLSGIATKMSSTLMPDADELDVDASLEDSANRMIELSEIADKKLEKSSIENKDSEELKTKAETGSPLQRLKAQYELAKQGVSGITKQ